jgi:hypothetical protein
MSFFAGFSRIVVGGIWQLADAIAGLGAGPVTFYPGALSFAAAWFVVLLSTTGLINPADHACLFGSGHRKAEG